MLTASLDAITALLHQVCPTVDRIYINAVPEGFKRPSFYVGLQDEQCTRRAKDAWSARITWLIIYFAPLDKAGNTDASNQIAVMDALQNALMNAGRLIASDGTAFNIASMSGGPYEGDVRLTVVLDAQTG